jgi:hypothetical protein
MTISHGLRGASTSSAGARQYTLAREHNVIAEEMIKRTSTEDSTENEEVQQAPIIPTFKHERTSVNIYIYIYRSVLFRRTATPLQTI